MTDSEILDLLVECEGNPREVAHVLVDRDVARGDYEGCSSDLEMAFTDYEARAKRMLTAAGG